MENNEMQLENNADPSVTLGPHAWVDTNEGLEAICVKLEDPEFPLDEICRRITLEIARLTVSMNARRLRQPDSYLMKRDDQLLRALRELSQQTQQAEQLRKKQDVLNFDGEKFKFVLKRIVEIFVQSMKAAGAPENLRWNIMNQYRDNMAVGEQQIRREAAKLGAIKKS